VISTSIREPYDASRAAERAAAATVRTIPRSSDMQGKCGRSPHRGIKADSPNKTIRRSGVQGMGRFVVLQWKARLLASLVTLSLVAAAFIGGGIKFIIYLDW
jgi:hypothetical protein